MNDRKLLTSLSKLGFPMFEPSEEPDINEILAEVVKSHDTRLWEGFPVLLANAAESYQFTPEQVKQQLTRKKQKDNLHRLWNFLWRTHCHKFFHQSRRNYSRKSWKASL
jgi:hypothetical protein